MPPATSRNAVRPSVAGKGIMGSTRGNGMKRHRYAIFIFDFQPPLHSRHLVAISLDRNVV
jgi:hypothetical protein